MNPFRFRQPAAIALAGLVLTSVPTHAGLLARYTLDNSANRLEDTSGNNFTAAIGSGVTATTYLSDTVAGIPTTVFSNAANASTSLALPNTAVTTATSTFSITGWMKTTDTNGYLFGQRDFGDDNTDRMVITPLSPNGVFFNGSAWFTGANNQTARNAAFADGAWHHFAFVVNETSLTIYRDGAPWDSMSITHLNNLRPVFTNSRHRFGADGDGSTELEGSYDDLRLYNHALTAGEVSAILNPGDTDSDGLPDVWELAFDGITSLTDLNGTLTGPGPGSDTGDYDGDGLSDLAEYNAETNPTLPDTDGDGIADKNELDGKDAAGVVHAFGPTDPKLPDSDSDGIRDDYELTSKDASGVAHSFGATNPNNQDSDTDGMNDLYEVTNNLAGGLNPNTDDAAGNLDGDSAGWTNLDEYLGTNTGSVQTRADKLDTDGDGLQDIVENKSGSWTDATATGTNPADTDTDDDGLSDNNENPDLTFPGSGVLPTNSNPNIVDTDADGLADANEISLGTKPAEADSDEDTYEDKVEALNGSNPNQSGSIPTSTAVFGGSDFGGGLSWLNVGAGVTSDPSSPLLTGSGNNGLLNSNANNTGAMVSFANPSSIAYYSIDVRYTGTLNGQGFNVLSGNNLDVRTSPTNHCALRFQTDGSFGYSNGGTFNSTAAPAGTHVADHTYTVQFVHDIPNNTYTIKVFDRSASDAVIFEVTPAVSTRNTSPGGTLYFGAGIQQDSTSGFELRLDNLYVSSAPIAPGTATATEPPVVTAIFFQGADLKIQFSPGGSGYILMSSDDLVAPFTQESAAAYDGVNTFTVPAAALNPGRDFFRVQTAP